MQSHRFLTVAFVIFLSSLVPAQRQTCSGISLGRGASLNGFVPFPADNAWNQDISNAPVDSNSTAIINFIGGSTSLHPDFGAGTVYGQIHRHSVSHRWRRRSVGERALHGLRNGERSWTDAGAVKRRRSKAIRIRAMAIGMCW